MDNNYAAYHLHSDYSLLDSCTKFQDYVDKAVELGQKAICFTEHGNIYNWVDKKLYCDEVGIKYLHGVEMYLTESHKEKIRDNFHTILIAKNHQGLLELNNILSIASTEDDHFYYKPRISFDEFFKLSSNIIKISACLASPLNRLPLEHPYYEKLVKHYDYLEIQPHNCLEQSQYNQHLLMLAQKYHKPLIAGTDTHSLNKYKAECRSILEIAKGIEFSNEDDFDLTYKSYDELVNMFKVQDALPEKYYMEAIKNTNVLADSIENFELDKTFKYPKLYDNDKEVYHNLIKTKFKEKIENNIIPKEQAEAFKNSIEEENGVFEKIDMCGFMLSMSEFVTWCKENNIPVGFNRGSVGGSREAYITDITDLNPEQWNTVFSRFANEDRKEIGDIDIDVSPDDREKVYNYIIERFTQPYTAFILALGTVSDKGTIGEIGRALAKKWIKNKNDIRLLNIENTLEELKNKPNKTANDLYGVWENEDVLSRRIIELKNSIENPYSLKNIALIKQKFETNPEETREKYPDIFYYFDGLLNTTISQSMHPAGIVVSPITLADNYGVFKRDDKIIIQIDMECIHEVSLVKYDILGLKNIGIIRDTYKLIGKSYPLSHEINWDDQKVWEDMLKSPIGIFQFEGNFAHSMLKEFVPKSIFDMSLVTAALRPSGTSYRNQLMEHMQNSNPSPLIDEILKDNLGYLIYQEDVIKFLTQICGMSGSEADNIRRAIGRKDEERLQQALPKILEGYCNKSPQPRETAEKEAKTFLEIIEDASSYMFGYNHSIGYCMIGYLCAYLRYYYPYEFITAYLNNANNEDDVVGGNELANEYNIKITRPTFGLSRAGYIFNKELGTISKGISSIKFLNISVAEELYKLSEIKYDSFMLLLKEMLEKTSINSRQLEILIKIDYFNEFGNAVELLKIKEIFDLLKQGKAKQISKDKIADDLIPVISPYVDGNKKDGTAAKTYKITDITNLMIALENHIKSLNIQDFNYREKMQNQLELLGYVDLITNKAEDRTKLLITDIRPLKGQYSDEPWGYAIFTKSIGTGKVGRLTVKSNLYKKNPIEKMDIIHINKSDIDKNKRGYWDLYNYNIIKC